MTNSLFPAFLKLRGRRVVVVGGGPVAASKLASLQSAGADLLVVAPEVCEHIRSAGVPILQKAFEPSDLDEAWFVVAAAPPEVKPNADRFSSIPLTIRKTRACISAASCAGTV
jgi:siroheme synthase-like protein